MDPLTQIALTRRLIDIDSTTGREAAAGQVIAETLRELGYRVTRQPVAGDRFNVMAVADAPVVVFSTHFDCVPPFSPSREEAGVLHGRGSCDAKGTIGAMIAAAERLRARGERRVGLLFVVGEERGSEGAQVANGCAPGSTFLIDGEPTDNRLGSATRGIYRVKLTAAGRAAHSSLPELGESAIEKLIDALTSLRRIEWPDDPVMGRTHYTVGLINGGIAPNVVPPQAEAEIMFRTVGDYTVVRRLMEHHVGAAVSLDDVLVVPPVRLKTVDGFDTAAFAFTTDIPWLDRWGTPLLLGPGSVTVAHTADEHVPVAELHRATELYERLARSLMSQSG
ncbi:MAG TPA: M20/M25/M40 family metallo-hydrolase [Vicinamibacterales bacterium]|nr:M20/M25/M40 family metallo-hydrolase [Vicinamibacterales bacterium]